jgi:K(+)-stimulated pyrophosphate-energized sodium pump
VEFIKNHIKLNTASKSASLENSKQVVKICTQFAQAGMFNIFIAIFSFAARVRVRLGSRAFKRVGQLLRELSHRDRGDRSLPGGVHGERRRMLDNAKKIVEVDLKEKGTALLTRRLSGDTVGDPFKDTSSLR